MIGRRDAELWFYESQMLAKVLHGDKSFSPQMNMFVFYSGSLAHNVAPHSRYALQNMGRHH